MADNLLDKASILLTPTAYNDGSMLSIKPENGDGDFTFSRSSAATRVNAQGLVENVQIISSELVSNGNFSQIGTEEVSNGNFSQEGSELVTNGDFSNGSAGWAGDDATLDVSNNTGKVIVTSNAEAGIKTSGVSSFVQGKQYKLTFDIVNATGGLVSGTIKEYSSSNIVGSWNGVGSYTIYFTYRSSSSQLRWLSSSNVGDILEIDNVSVKEVGQDWSLESGWSIGDGSLVANSVTTGLAFQSNIVEANKSYKATYSVVVTSGSVGLYFDGGTGYQGVVTTTQTITVFFKATTTSPLYFRSNTSNFTGSITNISVKEVGQDWTMSNGSISDKYNASMTAYQSGIKITPFIKTGKYKVVFDLVVTSGSCKFDAGGGNDEIYTTSGTKEKLITNPTKFEFNAFNLGWVGTLDNVSVKEITDDTDLPRINYEGFSYQDSLGSEEIVNGGFATDSGWVTQSGWSISGGTANCDGTANNALRQNFSLPVGTLRIKFDVTARTQGIVNLWINKPAFTQLISADAIGSYEVDVVTTSGANNVFFYSASNFTGSIDNVSVKEVLGQEVVPDSGCGSWLLEGQRTNLWTNSNLSASISLDGLTRTLNQSVSPSGDSDATLFNETATTGTHRFYRLDIPSTSTDFSMSFFAKKNGINIIRIVAQGGTKYADFDLSLGTVGNESGINSSAIEDYGNGWYRCVINVTATGWVGLYALNDSSQNSYLGNVSKGVYLWGAQLENQSFSTSYIPTSGAASTRLQDIANNSGNSTLINSTEGVLYAEIAALADDQTVRKISLSDGDGYPQITIGYDTTSNIIRCIVFDGTFPVDVVLTTTSYDILNYNKIAIKYKSGDSSLWVNGTEVDTSTNVFTILSTLNTLNFDEGSGASKFFGKNKALAVYKEALTDSNLRSLTYPNPVATTFDLDFDTIAEQFTFTRGSEATFVNAQGLIESTASNDAPRIDYSTGAKAFLLEPQSTNLIPYSEDFSNAAWAKSNVIITPNQGISPSGLNNAFKYVGSSISQNVQTTINVSSNYTYSFYVKTINSPFIRLRTSDGSCWFNMTTNAVATNNFASAEIKNIGNNWYRLSVTSSSFTSSNSFFIHPHATDNTSNELDGGEFLLWGAQLEQQSYATSYIPTSGASATRNQELCNNATPVINSEEGTLYAEISALADDLTNRYLGLSAQNIINNRIAIGFTSAGANRIRLLMTSGIGNYVDISYTVSNITSNTKIAISYKLNDVSLWVNGLKVGADTSAVMPSGLSELNFDSGTGNSPFFGNTKGLKYYPKALADVQLEDLTTI